MYMQSTIIDKQHMSESLVKSRLYTVVVLVVVTLVLWLPLLPVAAGVGQGSVSAELVVAFLDVGQGDAIFIQTPDGVQVLIDGGPDDSVLRALGEVLPWGDRSLDMVIGTHPDKDHVAGLVDVLERFAVAHLVRTENVNDTAVSAAFDAAVTAEGVPVTFARAGQVWALGASTTLTILSPGGNPEAWESNAASIVVLVRYGTTEFLLTGDIPSATEAFLVEKFGTMLSAEVLKLGHHGSKTSSSELFLGTVAPQYAVISAGTRNRYGHPHADVLERVRAQGAWLVSTAERGTIIFSSDGQRVWLRES
jgi:competence protein ComEC